MKYEFSVLDNISISDIHKEQSEESVWEILNEVKLDSNSFENDLNTILGKWFGDTELSSGEWQKIAISRGFYRRANLLVLDEPDAALDSIAEFDLIRMISEIFKERMGVFVSHKVSHIGKIATKIIVLDEGEISEFGSPEALLNQKGLYYQLYQNCLKV